MKTILAISAAIFAATPALAWDWGTRAWGEEACRMLRNGYGLKSAITISGTKVGSDAVLSSPEGELTEYVLTTCRSAAILGYDRDR
jgi:hypothetical protein